MIRTRWVGVVVCALLAAAMMEGRSIGPQGGFSGAPGDSDCTQCHSGTLNPAGGGRITLALPGNEASWSAGQQIKIRVTVSDPEARRWGFQLTARSGSGNMTAAGSFTGPSETTQNRTGNNAYIMHTAAGTFAGTAESATWEVTWTAPAAGAGTVTFYAAGNAANNNNANSGDRIYTTTSTLNEAASGGVSPGNRVVPQLVFGGGWSTRMYFSNASGAARPLAIRYYDNNGQPLPVNGSTAANVEIGAGHTAEVYAQDSGSLAQGWATFDLPEGVSGYAVFRQRVQGRPDQEAVVPFSTYSGSKWIMTWDERSGVRSGVAVVNPNNAGGVRVSLAIKDNTGAVIFEGPLPVTLSVGQKHVFVVRDLVPGVAGKYGVAEITSTGGSIAMIGLRFDDGGAVTTILAVNQ